MKNDNLLQKELFHIIAEVCNVDINKLTLETEIFKGLGCGGDDTYELLETICIK